MCNNKHLTLDDRLIIERELFFNSSFKKISKLINKDCTTVSKEIRNHIMYRNSGTVGRPFFDCINHYDCPHKIKGGLDVIPKHVSIIKKKYVLNYRNHLMFVMVVRKNLIVNSQNFIIVQKMLMLNIKLLELNLELV